MTTLFRWYEDVLALSKTFALCDIGMIYRKPFEGSRRPQCKNTAYVDIASVNGKQPCAAGDQHGDLAVHGIFLVENNVNGGNGHGC